MLFQKILKDAKGQPGTEGQPIVVLIDEVDAVIPNRKNLGSGSASADMRSTMLSMLHQIDKLKESNIMIIFTTNRIQDLDPAFKRTGGRTKYLITVDLPSRDELSNALDESLERHEFKKEEKPDWLIDKMVTEKFSYGDIEFLLDEVCELVNENNHPATEEDYQEATDVTIKRKKKVEELSEKEKKRNAEWEEKMFEQGKKECIEALKLNPDADLDKIIEDRKEKGLGSTRIRPWKKEYGTRLKCDSLEQQFLRNVTAYDRLYHDPDSKTSSSSAGWSLPVAENLHVNINNSKGIQTHHQLIPKGQLLVEQEWQKVEKCRKSEMIINNLPNAVFHEAQALYNESLELDKEFYRIKHKRVKLLYLKTLTRSQLKKIISQLQNEDEFKIFNRKAQALIDKIEKSTSQIQEALKFTKGELQDMINCSKKIDNGLIKLSKKLDEPLMRLGSLFFYIPSMKLPIAPK